MACLTHVTQKLTEFFFPRPIKVLCAAHNLPLDAEADLFKITLLDDLAGPVKLPPGLPWLEYSPPLLKKHGLVLGYEYNYGNGTYLWTFYDPRRLDEYSAAFDDAAENVFEMYVGMVMAGHGVLYLGSDERLIDYGNDEGAGPANDGQEIFDSAFVITTPMAGALRKDPAIEQFARMRENTSQYFKFNKKSGPFLFAIAFLLPLGVGYVSYHTHGQIQLAGLRRNQPFFRQFKEAEQPESE